MSMQTLARQLAAYLIIAVNHKRSQSHRHGLPASAMTLGHTPRGMKPSGSVVSLILLRSIDLIPLMFSNVSPGSSVIAFPERFNVRRAVKFLEHDKKQKQSK